MEFHDPLESCPFNVFHRIRRSRMQFHVTTCAQNHRHVTEMEQCPFDARHIVKHIEFEHHKRTCPARASVIDYGIHDAVSQAQLKILPIDVNPVRQWDEKWDDDADVKTYDPIRHIKNKPIVYALIGVSKTKRKNHRLQERIRYRRVIENERESRFQNKFYSRKMSTSSRTNTTIEVVHEIGDCTDESEKPLRPPLNFLVAHAADKTFDNYVQQIFQSAACEDPEISTSKFAQSSNHSSLIAALSSCQRIPFSRKSSEDHWAFEKSPSIIDVNASNNSSQEEFLIFNEGSVISSQDDYQFNPYKFKNQDKFFTPVTDSVTSNKDDYQFHQYQSNDQVKLSDTDSIASSKDDYQYHWNQSLDQENVSDTDSIVSSKDDYQFHEYQYTIERKSSIPDTISVTIGKGKYQCYHRQHENKKKLSISDTVSLVSSKDEYQFCQPLVVHTRSEMSLSSSISETSENDSVFSYQEGEPVIQMLSKTIEETTENDGNNQEFTITDTVYNVSSGNESQCIITIMNGSLDISLEEAQFSNHSLYNGIKKSSNNIINSIETNSTEHLSVFDKLSKTIEELTMDNEDYKKKSESLNQEINKLKKLPLKTKSRQINSSVDLKKDKLFSRCAANFLNLKQ